MKNNELEINGVIYVPKSDEMKKAERFEGMEYVIVRTYSAGVHAGYMEKKEGKVVTLRKSRRFYYWDGAATLSQLATEGVTSPENCKFPCEVTKIILTDAIEIIPCTQKAIDSIKGVPIWQK